MKTALVFASVGIVALLVGSKFAPPTPPPTTPPPNTPSELNPPPPEGHGGATTGETGGWPPNQQTLARIGQAAPAFVVANADGANVSLADFKGKVVVLEWINPESPDCSGKMKDGSVAKMMTDARAVDSGVVFLFVNSTWTMADKPNLSKDYLAANHVAAPALIDGNGAVGKKYGAMTTPHCFVINAKGVLVYAGAIDNKGSTNYVVNAVRALKDGKAVAPTNSAPYGTAVKYKP